jgi:hypothetical protein
MQILKFEGKNNYEEKQTQIEGIIIGVPFVRKYRVCVIMPERKLN